LQESLRGAGRRRHLQQSESDSWSIRRRFGSRDSLTRGPRRLRFIDQVAHEASWDLDSNRKSAGTVR
jgi:hypothetical protein